MAAGLKYVAADLKYVAAGLKYVAAGHKYVAAGLKYVAAALTRKSIEQVIFEGSNNSLAQFQYWQWYFAQKMTLYQQFYIAKLI